MYSRARAHAMTTVLFFFLFARFDSFANANATQTDEVQLVFTLSTRGELVGY